MSDSLWTVNQAAQHWDVSTSRARAILASRHIRRVSGYPADQVRAVQLRQGARTDLLRSLDLDEQRPEALHIVDVAAAMRTATERVRLRMFFEFMRGADEVGRRATSLIDHEPGWTGDRRFDVLLAAAAEHIASRWGQPGPLWTVAQDRFLDFGWWVSDLPSARALAMVWTPAAFRRHGIYLDRHDLTSDGACTMPEPVFGRNELRQAFTLLAERLERKGVVGHVHVIDGAAMLLACDSRVITRDVDALFAPDGPILEAVREVATQIGWPRSWLNNQASSYMSRTPGEGATVFDHPYLQVVATPADHLLAMKVLAARSVRDREDIELLFHRLKITSAATVWDTVARFFPDTEIPQRSRLLIDDLIVRDRGHDRGRDEGLEL
jgi:hypothetical protein